MPEFSYRARSRNGKEVRGVIWAEHKDEAVWKIRENYPVLLKIRQQTRSRKWTSILQMELGNPQIPAKMLAIFCSQFAVMLRAGIPVARVMQILAGQCREKHLRSILKEAAREVTAGSSVAAALGQYPERFSLTFIETVRAGEESGTLEQSFERLKRFYEKEYRSAEKLKQALTYPVFVLIVAAAVLIVLMTQVIPTLSGIFADLGGELPLITRILVRTSDFLAQMWLWLILAVLLICILWECWTRTISGRRWKAKTALLLPFVGRIYEMNAAAQFAGSISVLLTSGIPLNRALEITANVLENAVFQEAAYSMKTDVEAGYSLTEALSKYRCFPQVLQDLCLVGEETGKLEETLEHATDYYENEADHLTQQLLTLMEPTILIGMAFLAGIIVIAVYLPIFTMYDLM